jgi:hypothetical protein
MRSEGVLRVILNVLIPPGMPMNPRNEKYIEFYAAESATTGMTRFLLKFKNMDVQETWNEALAAVIPTIINDLKNDESKEKTVVSIGETADESKEKTVVSIGETADESKEKTLAKTLITSEKTVTSMGKPVVVSTENTALSRGKTEPCHEKTLPTEKLGPCEKSDTSHEKAVKKPRTNE